MALNLKINFSQIATLIDIDPSTWYLLKEIYTLGKMLSVMEVNYDSITLRKEFADDSVSEMNTTARTYIVIKPEFELDTQIQTSRDDLRKFIRIYESNLYTRRVLHRVTAARTVVEDLGKMPSI